MSKAPGLVVLLLMGVMVSSLAQPVMAQATFVAPEYVVEDQLGAVLGGLSAIAFKGQVIVAMQNATHDESYWVQVFTANNTPPATRLISEQLDVWYSGNNCTGTAYIKDPANAGIEATLRGATYAIGRKAGATYEDSIVFRGVGTGSDNSSSMMSKFKASNETMCENLQSTTVPTVVAVQVDDLSGFQRPFRYR